MKPQTRRRFLRSLAVAGISAPLSEALADSAGAARRHDAIQCLAIGYICRTLGRADQAIAHFTRAVELDADLTLAYTERAVLYDELGHGEEATLDYERGFHQLNEIAKEGGKRRQDVLLHSRQVARALADLARADLGDPYKRYALEGWLLAYDLRFPAPLG